MRYMYGMRLIRGISSAGRAPALQAGGRRFDPVILHHYRLQKFAYRTPKRFTAIAWASDREIGCRSLTIRRVESASPAESLDVRAKVRTPATAPPVAFDSV